MELTAMNTAVMPQQQHLTHEAVQLDAAASLATTAAMSSQPTSQPQPLNASQPGQPCPIKSDAAELTHRFSSKLTQSRMSRYSQDPWTEADNLTYNISVSAATANGSPTPFAMVCHSSGLADLKAKLSVASGSDLSTMAQRLATGIVHDNTLLGQLALLHLTTQSGMATIDTLERIASLKMKLDDSTVKTLGFIDRLRNPPGLSIKASQVNFATQQIVNGAFGSEPQAKDSQLETP